MFKIAYSDINVKYAITSRKDFAEQERAKPSPSLKQVKIPDYAAIQF